MKKKLLLLLCLVLSIVLLGPDLVVTNVWADDDAIMDVDDNAANFTGSWPRSTYRILYYGDDYQYAVGSGGSGASATATFTTAQYTDVSGYYTVYVRWTAGTARATNAYYRIEDSSGTYKGACYKDQTLNGGAWSYCASVYLDAGKRGVVKLTNANVPTNRYVCADAVRFVRTSVDNGDIVDEAGADFSGGNQYIDLSGTASTVRTVSISAPRSGKVIVNATGFFQFTSTTTLETGRCSITTGTTIDGNYLIYAREPLANTMYGIPFAGTRGFNVSSGTNTFRLVCDAPSGGSVKLQDSNMTAIFVSTTY